MKYTNSNVTFNNVTKANIALGGSGGYEVYDVTAEQAKNPEFELTDDKIPGKAINAINIDWNEADLSSAASSFANAADTAPVSTITTTGELMNDVYSPMYAKVA